MFYNVILAYLPSSSKLILLDNNIKLPPTNFLKLPLFNYISFCNFSKLSNEQEIYKLFISYQRIIFWRTSQPLKLFPGASA
ncbi:hypothetical protein C1645_831975 [Glomus cerebriforme]|uniref:Uncharacterized protein n=1 Tax=Glomus cerebriforme TaxID=658196 RepID=A0A397SIC8_9GLOM|nr:hypothetical protein C1645_831975 [Glomus cerebriforme]